VVHMPQLSLIKRMTSCHLPHGLLYALDVGQLGATDADKQREWLKDWIKTSKAQKMYLGQSRNDLASEYKWHKGKKAGKTLKSETFVEKLMKEDEKVGRHPVLTGKELLWQQLFSAVIESTFLHKLSPEQKEYCKMGHEAEERLASKLLRDALDNLTKIKVICVYKVGLVAKKGESMLRTPWIMLQFARNQQAKLYCMVLKRKLVLQA